MRNINYYFFAALSASIAMQSAVADNQIDPATGNTLHLSGNELPEPGFARPLFHVTQAAVSGGATKLTPAQVRHFYKFDKINNAAPGAGQIIALIGAYDNPAIESDLGVFSKQYGLPACTTANKCFKKAYAAGSKPAANAGWSVESALDVEWAHAIAPNAAIMLVEANSSSIPDLMAAVDYAVNNGANVVSMSLGSAEFFGEQMFDMHFNNSKAAHVTFVASAGDSGHGAEYPAASPYVVAVGGTSMHTADASAIETEPADQSVYKLNFDSQGYRAVPDVAYGADPNIGFSVYTSAEFDGQTGWIQVGGTSAGAPQWAAFFAIANQMHGLKTSDGATVYTLAKTGSDYAQIFNDVTSGTNGSCGVLCTAAKGYDYITGLGSPNAQALATDY
ncbi:MAG: S53 family peptidase [Methylomonas sp.]|jgi:subtilase family serine protease